MSTPNAFVLEFYATAEVTPGPDHVDDEETPE